MEQNAMIKNMWNAAGVAGLALGAVSSAYLFASQFIAGNLSEAVLWQQVIAIALWAIKIIACVWLMRFFMAKFASENSLTDRKTIFRMGMATAFLSALMFSAIYLANILYISADFYDQVLQTAIQQMTPTLDSNSMSVIEKVIDMLPQVLFFYYLTYCFLFGTVLSLIISRSIPTQENLPESQTDEQ